MSTLCHKRRAVAAAAVVACALASAGCSRAVPAAPLQLRVCADPNNLPFSNEREEGFENRLADLVASELGATVRYTWWAQRRGFVRQTLNAGECDVVMGVPAHYDPVDTTAPYYRSTYVFVSKRDRGLNLHSLDDARLRHLRIGVHLIGDDGANTPPVHALSRRGIVGNLIGFTIYGDYSEPNPPARVVEAVDRGEIDVAVVWGPLGGFFATRSAAPLEVTPVDPSDAAQALPFAYDIAMGVRHGDAALKAKLDDVIRRRHADIAALLTSFGVPRVDGTP